MEIRMQVLDVTDAGKLVLEALFTFVAKDRNTGRGAKINPLKPQSDVEQKWFAEAQSRAMSKKAARKATSSERALQIAQREADVALLMEAARPYAHLPALAGYGVDTLPISSTQLSNTLITQPQHQNTAGRVFGGFLMRRAFEIAFSCCYVFAGSRPHFLAVDDVTFKRPVDVGTMLQCDTQPSRIFAASFLFSRYRLSLLSARCVLQCRYEATVVYTEPHLPSPRVHVRVQAYV